MVNLSKIVSDRWPYFGIIIVSLISCYKIIESPGLMLHGDMAYPMYFEKWVTHFYPMWNPYSSVSNFENVDRGLFMFPLLAIGFLLNISIEWFIKIVFVATLIVSGISMYIFSDFIIKRIYYDSKLLPFICSIMFMFSPWSLEQLQAPFYWLAYALTPLMIFLFIKSLETENYVYIFLTAFLWSLSSSTPHYTVLTGIIFVIYYFYSIFLEKNDLVNYTKVLIYICFLYILFNFYWIFPYVKSMQVVTIGPGYIFTKDQLEMFSQNCAVYNILRVKNEWITWFDSPIYESTLWKINSFILPIFALSSLLFKRHNENKYVVYLSILVLFSIFFSLGSKSSLYSWLALESPIYNAFGWLLRVPSKATYLLWVIYPPLISLNLLKIKEILGSSNLKFEEGIFYFLVFMVVASYFFAIGPKLVAIYGFYYKPVEIPNEYYELNEWLEQQPGDFRVLFLAPYYAGMNKNNLEYETSFTWNPNRLAGYVFPRSSPKPSIGLYHYTSPWVELYRSFYPENINEVDECLRPIGVRYLIYHDDIVNAESQARIDIENLNKADVNLVKRFGDFIYVYEVPDYSERVYLNDTRSAKITQLNQKSATNYDIEVNASKGFTLIFTEAYDPLWALEVNGKRHLSKKSENHINEFKIEDSGILRMKIKYLVQEWFKTGWFISFWGLLMSTLHFVHVLFLNKDKVKN